jgi:hypothetical protein
MKCNAYGWWENTRIRMYSLSSKAIGQMHGRSSDLLPFTTPSHPLAGQWLFVENVYRAYSSGTVPDSHRIPFSSRPFRYVNQCGAKVHINYA